MSPATATTPFDESPEGALAILGDHRGDVVVDLDETLYLGNSTSDFIGSTKPAIVAYILLGLVDLVRPWRWRGGEESRDTWRVWAILTFMPWVLRRWRRLAPQFAADRLNLPLGAILRAGEGHVVISTLGFRPIVEPLVANLDMPDASLVAMNPRDFNERARGKLALTRDAVGVDAVAKSAVVTDSTVDLDLLAASQVPLRVIWPDAECAPIFERLYFPGRYVSSVKRPGSSYVRNNIVREDLTLWLVSSIGLATSVVPHVAGLCLLAISFWAVYERGYIDNDRIADRYEAEPQLTDQYHEGRLTVAPWKSLGWVVSAGVAGLFVLRWPYAPPPSDFAVWFGALAATFGVFAVFNRIDKSSRSYLFPLLQVARAGVFVLLVPILPVAAVALIVHVLIRWVPYHVYRLGGGPWPSSDLTLVRLIVFVLGAVLLEYSGHSRGFVSTTALALLAWHLVLARRSIVKTIRGVHRVDRAPVLGQ